MDEPSCDIGRMLSMHDSKQPFLKQLFRLTLLSFTPIELIHDGRHMGFAIIMQISYERLSGQTTQFREVIMNFLATQMICFTFIECLSPKQ